MIIVRRRRKIKIGNIWLDLGKTVRVFIEYSEPTVTFSIPGASGWVFAHHTHPFPEYNDLYVI